MEMIMHKIYLLGLTSLMISAASGCAASSDVAQSEPVKIAASQGYIKPGASIVYSHDLGNRYEVGETVTFQLKLGESYETGVMRVNIASEAVQLLATSGPTAFDMSRGAEHEMSISFTAPANGRHYINVQASADIGDDNPMIRAFSIPVQVGSVQAQKPNANMETMPDGESIIVMDAVEEIK